MFLPLEHTLSLGQRSRAEREENELSDAIKTTLGKNQIQPEVIKKFLQLFMRCLVPFTEDSQQNHL